MSIANMKNFNCQGGWFDTFEEVKSYALGMIAELDSNYTEFVTVKIYTPSWQSKIIHPRELTTTEIKAIDSGDYAVTCYVTGIVSYVLYEDIPECIAAAKQAYITHTKMDIVFECVHEISDTQLPAKFWADIDVPEFIVNTTFTEHKIL